MMVKEGYKKTILGELPADWNYNFLSDLLNSLISGNRPKGGVRNIENGIPSLGGEHLNDTGSFDFEEMRYVPESFYKEMNKGKIKDNDILICKDGAKTGKISYLEENPFKNASINEHIFILRSDNNKIKSKFLFYFLFSKKGQDQIKKSITGSAQPGINRKFINPILIPCPPFPEQKKISSILSSVDKSIEKTEKLIEKSKELKKGLMQQLLTRGIGHSEFKEIRLGVKTYKAPINWKVTTIKEITNGKPRYGANSSAKDFNSDLPRYVRITDLSEDGFLKNDDKKSIPKDEAESYFLEKGDIVFARSGATVGKTYIYDPKDGLCAYAGYLIRFKINTEKIIPEYLLNVTHSYYYFAWLKSMIRATSQPNINSKEYASFDLLLPPLLEQKKIASILSSVDAKIQKEEEYKAKLEELKKGLMQKLLTGEIRVNTEMEV